jgi:predicted dehydrogenase
MTVEPIRIGLIGASRIAGPAVVIPARDNDDVIVVGVAARDRKRAVEYAKEHEIPRVFDTYDDLCVSEDIDVVYVATPPVGHLESTRAALAAGKHVLCEKPLAMNALQTQHMIELGAASGLVLMEAFHWRYHPMAARITEIMESGVLGELIEFDALFTIPFMPVGDFRWQLAAGGGALMDLGCYPVQWARHIGSGEPKVISAQMVEGPTDRGESYVDMTVTAELQFDDGFRGRIHSDMSERSRFTASLTVTGSLGTLVVNNPLAPQLGNSIAITSGGSTTNETVSTSTTYDWQMKALVDAVRNGTVLPTGGADSIATMTLIDSIYRTAGFGPRPGKI